MFEYNHILIAVLFELFPAYKVNIFANSRRKKFVHGKFPITFLCLLTWPKYLKSVTTSARKKIIQLRVKKNT